jgi:hypothetical protein
MAADGGVDGGEGASASVGGADELELLGVNVGGRGPRTAACDTPTTASPSSSMLSKSRVRSALRLFRL